MLSFVRRHKYFFTSLVRLLTDLTWSQQNKNALHQETDLGFFQSTIFLLWSSHFLLTTFNLSCLSENNKELPRCKENKVRSALLLSKINNYMAHASRSCCGSEELLEDSVGGSSCCWWRDLCLLSVDLAGPGGMRCLRQFILPQPSIFLGGCLPPLSLHGRREHMAAYLCSCCSYVLSGLMVLGSSGGFAWGEGPTVNKQIHLSSVVLKPPLANLNFCSGSFCLFMKYYKQLRLNITEPGLLFSCHSSALLLSCFQPL